MKLKWPEYIPLNEDPKDLQIHEDLNELKSMVRGRDVRKEFCCRGSLASNENHFHPPGDRLRVRRSVSI